MTQRYVHSKNWALSFLGKLFFGENVGVAEETISVLVIFGRKLRSEK